jgi:dTDP-glucose pyrophosphorylase
MASLVLCMAGLNTRFHDVGFDIPKYLLPWGDETIIHEIIKQLGTFDETILLANKRDSYFKTKLVDTIKSLGLTENNIQYIGDTDGQAHTAYIGASLLKDQTKPFFVHNADTLLLGRNFKQIESLITDAYIDVFIANNPKYSYVRSKDGIVTDIVEKSPISPFASSGLYGFANAELYKTMYHSLSNVFVGKEMYIANLLTHMIEKGCSIGLNELNNNYQTIVLGTPQEYGLELAKLSLNKK